jgi:5-formyltetrahydrofolate cyclo-ligase
MTKAELRKLYLLKRSELSVAEIAEASKKIADRFFREIELGEVKSLSTFIRIAKFNEVDTSAIYYRLWKDRPWVRTYAPRTDVESGELENLMIFPDTPLTENRWGVREPAAGESIDPALIDVVIVPVLCADAEGHRVGYGKGFYDRFLTKCRSSCLKIGVNYFGPVSEPIDSAEHDVRLDACITPEALYRF